MSTPGKSAALAVTHISPKEAKSTHIERAVLPGRLGSLSLAQPTARRPRQRFKVPSVRKVVPLETRKRRSSDRSLRSTLAICSGIGFRSLASTVAAEHELAGLVSFDYGQRA
ncbi:hypothetical protein EOC93_29185 [Mesorhizobium sp. M6A.T.Ce.TU.002.03.1.1]|nr:hypothetical protein EOC93_29185 [Mesorhizobium sp. M6A.T.Ce.TU.002.03.1.1]